MHFTSDDDNGFRSGIIVVVAAGIPIIAINEKA